MAIVSLVALLVIQTDDPYREFDALGFPDLKSCPYVRVATGQSRKRPGRGMETWIFDGFLLEETGPKFAVLGLDLERHDFKKSATADESRVGYEKLDLAAAVEEKLKALKSPSKNEERNPWERMGMRYSVPTELFVLSRACDRQGHPNLARDLLAVASTMPDPRTGKSPEEPLARRVVAEVANARTWQAVLDFGNPEIPWSHLLETFRELEKRFPGGQHSEMVKETVRILDTIAREEVAHREPARPLAELPVKDRVAELIYRLRDQNGAQYSQPGQCDFFADPRGEQSPAHQLVVIGAEAVPQLIDALEDTRFTRSVGFHRGFYFSHHVLRVGDAALAVLEKIAGKRFFERTYTNGAMTKDRAAKATKEAVQAWWADFQKKGEKQVLVEAAEKGDLAQAQRLLERHPELALPAFSKALGSVQEGHTRGTLIKMVAKIPGEESAKLLLTELKAGPHVGTRMAAAQELIRRGNPEVPALLIEEWKKSAAAKRNEDEEFFEKPTEAIIVALVATGRPEAIRALAADFSKRSLRDRVSVVFGLSDGDDFFTLDRAAEKAGRPPGVTLENERESATAAEDLLASVLDDTTVLEGRSASRPGLSFSDPRFCDVAAHILAFRWPKKYVFNIGANRKVRDRQVVETRNAWRRSRGMDPLPVPADKSFEPLAAAVVDPLVDALLRGDTGSEEALESKGLPALKAAQERVEKLEKNHAHRMVLEGVVRRLGCIVAEVRLSPAPAANDDALSALVSGLEGKSMTPASLRAFVEKGPTVFPPGVVGFHLTVDRESDLGGIRVLVETVTETVPRGRSVGKWAMNEIVLLGQEGLLHYGGNSRKDYATTAEGWKMLKEPVETVFATPPTKSFSIRISRVQMN